MTAVMLFRYYRHLHIDVTRLKDWDLFFRKQIIIRLDSIMYSVLGAWINFYAFEKWIKYKKALLITGIVIFLFCKDYSPYMNSIYFKVFSFSLFSFATLLMLPFLSELKYKGNFYRPITYVSLISYSMYLLNLNVIQILIINKTHLENYIQNEFMVNVINYFLYWILIIVLSILLYKYYELPMMKLRDSKSINFSKYKII